MSRILTFAAVTTTVLSILACGSDADDDDAPATPASDAAAPADGPGAHEGRGGKAGKAGRDGKDATVYTLLSVTAGDTACYLGVRDGGGVERQLMGAFEVCPGGADDATPLIGKSVHVRTRPDKVAAPSCQGAPDCTDTVDTDLVIKVGEVR